MDEQTWTSEDVDINEPSVARVYDYFLGGVYNFEADRAAAENLRRTIPYAPLIARTNRAFLGRVVKYYLDVGITQFIDLGSGLPSLGNVHELAQQHNPKARVLYVDIDPVAVTHCRLILKDNELANSLYADLREPAAVLNAPETIQLIDFAKPVGVLLISVMHFVPDHQGPAGIIAAYLDRLAPGSHLAISQGSDSPEMQRLAGASQQERLALQPAPRSRAEIETLFTGLELVPPGVTWIEDWRPEPNLITPKDWPTKFFYGAVGRV